MKKLGMLLLRQYYRVRAMLIVSYLLPSLRVGERVLDVGAGTMEVAQELVKAGMIVEGVDVIDINVTNLTLKKFDGLQLPYDDNEFEVVLLLYVLHHMPREKQAELLAECLRVASRVVLVAEDVYENRLELEMVKMFDRTNAWLAKEMALPLSFRKEREWREMFNKIGFGKVEARSIRSNRLRPTRHRLFSAEKGD
jgi:ubiquinone/menaquinone biosynthesis C-methylase UbiE